MKRWSTRRETMRSERTRGPLLVGCACLTLSGCAYDPTTGTYALDPKALELISNIAVSSLANSMSRGEKDGIDRHEARAAAIDLQSVHALFDQAEPTTGFVPIEPQGQFGSYTCGDDRIWLSGFLTKQRLHADRVEQGAAEWTAARYATDNSLNWDGTPYRFTLQDGDALMLVRYNAAQSDIGWVRITYEQSSFRVLASEGTHATVPPFESSVFQWDAGTEDCDVTLFIANSGPGIDGVMSGVFWFD
ncbi:MAG: hypothetical protein KDA20_12390 [Phycisphaerales bacterium]|nr:hypothetical protein [Phycisphaerales bacterium]